MPKIDLNSLWGKDKMMKCLFKEGAVITGEEFMLYVCPIIYLSLGHNFMSDLQTARPDMFAFLTDFNKKVGNINNKHMLYLRDIVSLKDCVNSHKACMSPEQLDFVTGILSALEARVGTAEDFCKKVNTPARFLKMPARDIDLQVAEYEPHADSSPEFNQIVTKCRERIAEILGARPETPEYLLADNGPKDMGVVDNRVKERATRLNKRYGQMKAIIKTLEGTPYENLPFKES